MMTIRRLLLINALVVVAIAAGAAWSTAAESQSDRDAVYAAALDYVEGIYNVEPERLERSVHPDMVKRGYYRRNRADTEFVFAPMTREQLIKLAGDWNKDRKRPIDTYPKEVIVHEVLNQTASAKVVAQWGIDYMHLAKHEGRWKIVNILWQEPPPSGSR